MGEAGERGGLSDLVDALTRRGYTADFRAVAEGRLASGRHCSHAAEELRIDDMARFEGASDPDDQAVVFALSCRAHETRGTYVVAFGPLMDALDVSVVRRLGGRRRQAATRPPR